LAIPRSFASRRGGPADTKKSYLTSGPNFGGKLKPQVGEGWINGGYFVFNYEVFDYLKDDQTILEREPLENLSKQNELVAYRHEGFWHCMDTIRDRDNLNEIWASGNAPWKK